jgi:hypothetical protein
MEVTWKRADGAEKAPVVVEPAACNAALLTEPAAAFTMSTPPDTALACPDAVASMRRVLATLDPRSSDSAAGFPLREAKLAWLLLPLLLLGSGAVAIRGLRPKVNDPAECPKVER